MGNKVTYNDIEKVFNLLLCAYGNRLSKVTVDTIPFWYEMFQDCDRDLFFKAIKSCINTCDFPPDIAEIKTKYNELDEVWESEKKALKTEWNQIVSWYPKSRIDKKADPYLGHILMRHDNDEDRLLFMQQTKWKIINYVKEHIGEEVPLLSDLIRELTYGGNR